METMQGYISELHRAEEAAYIAGDQAAMDMIGAELDEVVTDEMIASTKGEL